jgi:hypothetical protein
MNHVYPDWDIVSLLWIMFILTGIFKHDPEQTYNIPVRINMIHSKLTISQSR